MHHVIQLSQPITVVDHVAIDFEGTTKDGLSLKDIGIWNYLHHPDQETFLVAICAHEKSLTFVGHPKDYDWTKINGLVWAAHNSSFDEQCFQALIDLQVLKGKQAKVRPSKFVCTSALAAYLRSNRNLKDASYALLPEWSDGERLEVKKSIRKLMQGKSVEEMHAHVMPDGRTLYEHSCEYCWLDALASWDLWARWSPFWPEKEQRISWLTSIQSQRGFEVDVERLEYDLQVLNYACHHAKSQLPWMLDADGGVISDDEGVLSIPKLKEAIVQVYGLKPPVTTSEDTETCRAWELAHPECQLIGYVRDFRKLNILRRKYEYVKQRLIRSGPLINRFQFAWMYGGAHTLRWAGGSSYRKGGTGEEGFNIQNMNKEPMFIEESGEVIDGHDRLVRLLAGEETAPYSIDIRALVVTPRGKKLVIADAEQIEPRITLWLAGEFESLKKIAEGMSVYEVHARKSMGWTGGNIKQENPKEQFLAKQRVIALGYGCGWKKFQARCKELGRPIPSHEAKHQVNDFRAKEKKIVACWNELEQGIQAIARHNTPIFQGRVKGEIENYVIHLPSGRALTYYAPWHHLGYPYKDEEARQKAKARDIKKCKDSDRDQQWKPTIPFRPDRVQVWAKTELNGKWKAFYGGLLFENKVQAIARDILAEMILAMDDHDFDSLFTAHDEIVSEVGESVTSAEIKSVMDVRPEWTVFPFPLPISVEAKAVTCYTK